jgi:hypothetical protein
MFLQDYLIHASATLTASYRNTIPVPAIVGRQEELDTPHFIEYPEFFS